MTSFVESLILIHVDFWHRAVVQYRPQWTLKRSYMFVVMWRLWWGPGGVRVRTDRSGFVVFPSVCPKNLASELASVHSEGRHPEGRPQLVDCQLDRAFYSQLRRIMCIRGQSIHTHAEMVEIDLMRYVASWSRFLRCFHSLSFTDQETNKEKRSNPLQQYWVLITFNVNPTP